MTVGELKKWIKDFNIPDDATIWYERIEDVYFKKHGWQVRNMSSDLDSDINTQFVSVFSPIKYKDDKDLYLTAHY